MKQKFLNHILSSPLITANIANATMKVQLVQIASKVTICMLCATTCEAKITAEANIYESLTVQMEVGIKHYSVKKHLSESVLSLLGDSADKDRRRNDIGHNKIKMNGSRRLHGGSGKGIGIGKGGTDSSNLDICSNRQYENVAAAKRRSLNSLSNYEKESLSKGKSGNMGSRTKNIQCISKKRGKGGSSKSKYSRGKASDVCADYDYSSRRQLEYHRKKENQEIKTILDIVRGTPRLSIFADLVEKTSLSVILACNGPFTVLIPANRAFRTLDPAVFADLLLRDKSGKLDDILKSHVVPGRILSNDFLAGNVKALNGDIIKVSINPLTFQQNATAGAGDIIAGNGVIHIIDSVLFTNASESVCNSGRYDFDSPSCGRGCAPNIIDLACEKPNLSTFLSLIQRSGLNEIFDCRGPFTIFAPLNDAFDDLREHLWVQLLKPENFNDLKDFLLYHIVPGSFQQQQLRLKRGEIPTLLFGNNITISVNPLMINNAKFAASDALACNGVLHIVDKVLDSTQLSQESSSRPILAPSEKTATPTSEPSTQVVSLEPSVAPSRRSVSVSIAPTSSPSQISSATPSKMPISSPTLFPSETPTIAPSSSPTTQSAFPTIIPSLYPSANPSAAPSEGVIRININRSVYFAYVSEATMEPTPFQYSEARRITIEYYNKFIRSSLMMSRPMVEFIEWNATLLSTRFNAGIPSQRFNIYMEYVMVVAIYARESRNVPSPGEFLNLVKDGYVDEYLLNVTSLVGTPFELVNEGVFSTI